MMEYILVTGGAGYIGSHTVIELVKNGYNVIILDNLSNSCYDAVARIEFIVKKPIKFFNFDLRDSEQLSQLFLNFAIKGVIHFAAMKAVGESTQIPLQYYNNNVTGTISLLETMKKHQVKTFVFSSSATVYGDATRFDNMIPIPEHCPNDPTNPYGKTKYFIENIVRDVHASDKTWRAAILRYFNPIGAHPSGLIGEDPLGIPNNLLPFLAQVAIGKRDKLSVFGNDYDSHDGTPIRDYIHVVDLARGHIAALNYLNKLEKKDGLFREWNLGTGRGSTVFDIYNSFCKAVGRKLPYEVVGRREGDVLDLTANPSRANAELGWKAEFSIDKACQDLWKWTTENPAGFRTPNYTWKLFNESKTPDYRSRLHSVEIGDFNFSVANYGALIQSIKYQESQLINKLDTLAEYKSDQNPLVGSTVGRFANRISNGSFEIDGKKYSLSKNDNSSNTLHGGPNGFHKQYFLGPVAKLNGQENTLEFILVDEEDNNGFPAQLETVVKYTIGHSFVELEYEAKIPETSEANKTAVNISNHTYWNLTAASNIDGTKIKTSTNKYLKVAPTTRLPTGDIASFDPDLTQGITLNSDIVVDNCFVVDSQPSDLDTRNHSLTEIASITHEKSPVKVVVKSTEPAFQLYTGDYNNIGPLASRSGLSFEPSRFLDAINHEKWNNQVLLAKGETFGSKTRFEFHQ